MSEQLKILIIGATGKVGRCLVLAGLERNLQISVFIRNPAKLEELLGIEATRKLNVFVGDALNQTEIEAALRSHTAAINAAVHRSSRQAFENICRSVINAANTNLNGGRRFWQFGGLPGLDVPHTKTIGADLPGMPDLFKSHKTNYNLLKKTTLDWTFICPGPMYFANRPTSTTQLQISEDVMPYQISAWTKWLPKIAHPFIMRSHLDELSVAYEDVAAFIMDNLESNSLYSHKRIGIVYKRN